MVASVRMLGYGGSRQPLIMADFKEAKKNLHREWSLLSEACGGGGPPPLKKMRLIVEGLWPAGVTETWGRDLAGA